MKPLIDWLDNRTGIRGFMHEALYERIPGGARWRYVWGSTLVFAFFVQMVTGIFLWMAYSPSGQTAWESVYYIQHEMQGGWLLRGLHHFMAQAMIVLLVLHLMQVVIDGAYRAPREINFWLGLILMMIVLALSLTGYLLPWDQKGYWATRVATNLMGLVPFFGEHLQKLVLGGSDYGHHTLTRFFALHAGVLPALLIGFLVLHVALFRRHGLTVKDPRRRPDTTFWPDQVLRDAVACLAVLIAVLVLCALPALTGRESWSATGQLGAELGAPADPSNQYSAARPEWYFLFLFQFLKLFEGQGETGEVIGAIVVPGLIVLMLFLMPLIGRSKAGHRFNVGFLAVLMLGIGWLTYTAWNDDNQANWTDEKQFVEIAKQVKMFGDDDAKMREYFDHDADKIADFEANKHRFERFEMSREYLRAVKDADAESHRVAVLAAEKRIPPAGALALLNDDPGTQGPRLFNQYCISCHDYVDPAGTVRMTVDRLQTPKVKDGDQPDRKPTVLRTSTGQVIWQPNGAPNLYGFASRDWIAGFLDPAKISLAKTEDLMIPADATENDPTKYLRQVVDAPYFGNTKHRSGDMVNYVRDPEGFGLLKVDAVQQIIAALSAQAELPAQRDMDEKSRQDGTIAKGDKLILSDENCMQCHHYGKEAYEPDGVPDLTGYGSRQWLIDFIANPSHARFYGDDNDRMPAFAKDGSNPTNNTLSMRQIELLADWIRGDYYLAPKSTTAH